LHSFILSVALLLVVPVLALAAPDAAAPPTDLVDYVAKKDESFSWKLTDTRRTESGTVYELDLVSQTWHDIKWDHKLQVFVPKDAKPQATMVLWNQGGTPNLLSGLLGLKIADRIKAPVAFLFGVPKQPLFDGKREDSLIAETFVQYLETKDGSWPLLFPMVKSVVKAMDALQQFAKQEWAFELKDFVVTGASKRGWTAWLTAATGDPRVKAIAPIVIDTLNLPVQMKNQVAAFGKPSAMIRDYTARKLIPIPETPEGQKLWKMVDPWVYREKLALPKMIINGANDPYWPLDALNSYWDDLKGDKWVLYVPNAGHDLRELDKDGNRNLLPTRAVDTLAAFCYCQIFDKKMPKLIWTVTEKADVSEIKLDFEGKYRAQRICVAEAETRDFRKSRWSDQIFVQSETGTDSSTGFTFKPVAAYRAAFIECEYEVDKLTFTLSSRICITEPKKK
jgi:PhoPQ-activated pathogenicity-related protein